MENFVIALEIFVKVLDQGLDISGQGTGVGRRDCGIW